MPRLRRTARIARGGSLRTAGRGIGDDMRTPASAANATTLAEL
jgi:hypothetical protein